MNRLRPQVKMRRICLYSVLVSLILFLAWEPMPNARYSTVEVDRTKSIPPHGIGGAQKAVEDSRPTSVSPAVTANLEVTAADSSQVGQWDGPFAWPLVAIHMALLPTGEILMWDGPPEDGGSSARLWN